MRVFMLGWEFPPFVSGGLGTACYGLTKAMSRQNVPVTFVLPKTIGSEYHSHVRLLAPQSPRAAQGDRNPADVASTYTMDADSLRSAGLPVSSKHATDASGQAAQPGDAHAHTGEPFEHVTFKAVPSRIPSPYLSAANSVAADGGTNSAGISFINPATALPQEAARSSAHHLHHADENGSAPAHPAGSSHHIHEHARAASIGAEYSGDLMAEARRYADLCVDLADGEDFDVVHAHDWMTFPAGMAVAAHTGKPLVVHVHATEFDRAGENVHSVVYDIERRGMHAAVRVIAVSRRTRQIVVERYGVDPDKVRVVYNGVENGATNIDLGPLPQIDKNDKVVLFLGRVTMQKGPEYFLQAAKRVLEKIENVKFVVAGSGDKLPEAIETVARYGIGSKFVFTGFLRGDDVERVLRMADVFVMPSVSEPFGIAPLEAINNDVPVIISKQSGVSEVLDHALKVDFWDVDEIANKILAVLKHAPLSATLREHATVELRRLTWDGAAEKVREVYEEAAAVMPA